MEIANVEQAEAWDGHEGDQWTDNADRYESASSRVMGRFDLPAVIGDGDRVLDVGCGTGRTTLDAARLSPSGSALGVDLSSRMLAYATERAAAQGVDNVRYEQADAQVHLFEPGSVDVVISSFGVMFFADPAAAWANLARALRPGGRLAVLAWRRLDENGWLTGIRSALALGRELGTPPPDAPTPFSLADPARVQRLLGTAGFVDVDLVAIDEPIVPGQDADDAFGFLGQIGIVEGLLEGVGDAGRAEGLANVRALLKEHETDEGVLLPSAAWRISATLAG